MGLTKLRWHRDFVEASKCSFKHALSQQQEIKIINTYHSHISCHVHQRHREIKARDCNAN